MKAKTWLPIALALVLGLFAAVLAMRLMSSRNAAAPTVTLAVAVRAVPPGEALTATDLDLRAVAADAVPEGAHREAASLVGRTPKVQLVQGQPVLESLLAPEGTASGLQALVPPGLRAMTIEVNEFSSVGGMVTPGSRVDIISTMQDARHSESMSRTIAQNVLVKAVGQETGQVNDKGVEQRAARSVTLIVSSKQAEAIQLSAISGRPWLVLRGANDDSIASLAGTTLAELRGAMPSMANDILTALSNARNVMVNAPSPSPATQPVASRPNNWVPPRSVHTIRNTIEATVSVHPTTPQREVVTGATIEP